MLYKAKHGICADLLCLNFKLMKGWDRWIINSKVREKAKYVSKKYWNKTSAFVRRKTTSFSNSYAVMMMIISTLPHICSAGKDMCTCVCINLFHSFSFGKKTHLYNILSSLTRVQATPLMRDLISRSSLILVFVTQDILLCSRGR